MAAGQAAGEQMSRLPLPDLDLTKGATGWGVRTLISYLSV
jgi:hypothetical protein